MTGNLFAHLNLEQLYDLEIDTLSDDEWSDYYDRERELEVALCDTNGHIWLASPWSDNRIHCDRCCKPQEPGDKTEETK